MAHNVLVAPGVQLFTAVPLIVSLRKIEIAVRRICLDVGRGYLLSLGIERWDRERCAGLRGGKTGGKYCKNGKDAEALHGGLLWIIVRLRCV